MKYHALLVIFEKAGKIEICRLLQIIGGALRVNASTVWKNSCRNIIRVSNSLDPDQARQNVGHDLGPNCLQRLSADDKFCC